MSISITPEIEVSDSDNSECGTSLLHQALKRKRTESETENLYKRQFYITTAAPNTYFSPTIASMAQSSMRPLFNKPSSSSSLLTSALTSPPKAMRHLGNTTAARPIFRIIPANRLAKTHVELTSLLQNNTKPSDLNKGIVVAVTSSAIATSTTSTEAATPTASGNSSSENNNLHKIRVTSFENLK
jgi:hypothetical protein